MLLKPAWYKFITTGTNPPEEDKIKSLTKLRKQYGLDNTTFLMAIMSTPWALKKVQYDCIDKFKRIYTKISHTEKDLWKMVLLDRLQVCIKTASQVITENSKITTTQLTSVLKKLIDNINEFMGNFNSFEEVVQFIVCLQEWRGGHEDPWGIIDALNNIFGVERPSIDVRYWFIEIMRKSFGLNLQF